MHICVAESKIDILRCFPLMKQLRTDLEEPEFLLRVQRQMESFGYRLAFVEDGDDVKGVAGFRLSECLADGTYLYVDDLVVKQDARSQGHGGQLFDWIVNHARQNHCQVVELDSGVQRFEAHRFYFKKRMRISSHHFSLDVE
ncbi:MAG: GNAT family N-acetyltransferase [Elainellaceae cyanobacterium]